MYSVVGETVLDPFWGTGTTSLAAMAAARDSIGFEREPSFAESFDDRVDDAPALSRAIARTRLDDHRAFVDGHGVDDFAYEADHYDFPVTTKQERSLRLYAIEDLTATDDGYRAVHEPIDTD